MFFARFKGKRIDLTLRPDIHIHDFRTGNKQT